MEQPNIRQSAGVGAEENLEAIVQMNSLTVTIVEHPKGFLMRIEHDGASITLDRDEALDLYDKLSAKLGAMPVILP